MNPELSALESHLRTGRFRAGEVRGRWRLLALQWPHAFVEIAGRGGRSVCIRFECSGYPERPPTGTPWDFSRNQPLPSQLWPAGGRVSSVFNPGWRNGVALYIPCDREAIAGHANWNQELPHLIWNVARGLTQYVEAVYEILQSHALQPLPA